MQRLTVNDLANSRLMASVGIGSTTDPRFYQYLNEAQQRMLTKGLWVGTVGKFQMAAYDGCISLPPSIAALESAALNHKPVAVKDQWFEFLEFGFGTRSAAMIQQPGSSYFGYGISGLGIPEAVDRGTFPTFRDITADTDTHKIVVVCDLADDVTGTSNITVTVTGWDMNGNWIRTKPSTTWVDGEVMDLAQSPGTISTNTFSRIAAVQFSAARSGQVWIYDSDTTANTLTMIGRYEYWETNPSYRRWYLPSVLAQTSSTPPASWQTDFRRTDLPAPVSNSNPSLLEVMAKLEYRPVSNLTDYTLIQSIPAFKFFCQAIKKQEDAVSSADMAEALAFEAKGIAELDDQLDFYLGTGRRIGMNVVGSCVDNEPIEIFQ